MRDLGGGGLNYLRIAMQMNKTSPKLLKLSICLFFKGPTLQLVEMMPFKTILLRLVPQIRI